MPFLWTGRAERETLMDKTVISDRARARQKINAELRKKGKDIPGAQEIGELIQDDLDIQVLAFKQANDMDDASESELTQVWPDVMGYVNDRPLNQDAMETLVALSEQYSIHEVVAIVDYITFGGTISLDVIADEPELQIKWRTIAT